MKWIILTLLFTTDISAYYLTPKDVRTKYPAAYLPIGGILIFSAYHFGDKLIMKKRKIPKGYESTQMIWDIDPYESASNFVFACPEGWQFFELIRKDTKATVTYIRPIQVYETV